MQRLKNPAHREFYIRESLTHGWSRSILEMQIQGQLHLRTGKALNNFAHTMPPAESDMAAQLFKDPYLFDFLGTADPRREAEVEQALMDHVQRFLLELGAGFAFVGRRVALEVGGSDFYIDLLFYHLRLRRYVVIELKARAFVPGDVGQINLYRAAVDDLLRHPDDQPTIGLLLCRGRTSSSSSMRSAAWINPSPWRIGRRSSRRSCPPSFRAACRPSRRSRRSWRTSWCRSNLPEKTRQASSLANRRSHQDKAHPLERVKCGSVRRYGWLVAPGRISRSLVSHYGR
jgi:predicted nuclease of restriction endonuclease-like (RecB) superfamily